MPPARDMPQTDTTAPAPRASWYRQPVVWLGVALFVASLAGCVWIIMAAAHHPDTPLDHGGRSVLGVPAAAHSSHGPPPAAQP